MGLAVLFDGTPGQWHPQAVQTRCVLAGSWVQTPLRLTVLWWEMIITADVIYRPEKEREKCSGETVKERNGGRIYQVERKLLEEYRSCIPTAVLRKPEILQSN